MSGKHAWKTSKKKYLRRGSIETIAAVEQALAAGHYVVAYILNPSKLNVSNERLKVIQGELADESLIESAVKEADAVISVLGPRGG